MAGLLDYISPKYRGLLQQGGNALDFVRGGLLGMTTDAVGYIPDAVADAMRPFGYNVPRDQVVGGTGWLANKLTTPTGNRAETMGRLAGGLLSPGIDDVARMAGLLPQKAAPVQELITYHGSPHRINNVDAENPMGKFDLSKVGTGEGAQAYGHGIYLAESPDVAKQYQKTLSYRDSLDSTEWKLPDALAGDDAAKTTVQYLSGLRGMWGKGAIFDQLNFDVNELKAITQKAKSQGVDLSPKITEELAQKTSVLATLRKHGIEAFQRTPGHFYTVDLPDEHIAKMLDWDAPLSEQPEAVRKAYVEMSSQYVPFKARDGWDLVDKDTGGLMGLYFGSEKDAMDHLSKGVRGQDVYADFVRHLAGSSMDGQIGQKKASKYLRSLGIPGIKYFDGGSRAKGEGTRNFVIFSGDTAKILKRE